MSIHFFSFREGTLQDQKVNVGPKVNNIAAVVRIAREGDRCSVFVDTVPML
jgi:hypothetical protein